jgi:hypothetical protein
MANTTLTLCAASRRVSLPRFTYARYRNVKEKYREIIFAIALLTIVVVPAKAVRHSGNDLLRECTSTDATTERGVLPSSVA